MLKRSSIVLLSVLSLFGDLPTVWAEDWPMWRCTPGRTAVSREQLGDDLELLWTRKLTPRKQTWDDPLNQDLMTFDRVFEPIVMGGKMFVGFNDTDRVVAYDASTGAQVWTFFTDAPVRLAPAGWNGRVYFTSDDGKLYCVSAEDGSLAWQFAGGPNSRKAIGNSRLISAWPARGGPVVRDGRVYFAASIWPFMGVYIYALDAVTGEIVWVNDDSGEQYLKQPHSAPAFGGVAPQGNLVATHDTLLVPGGRSIPAAFDRHTGAFRYFEINAAGKGTGGSFVAADDQAWFVHTRGKGTRQFNLADGVKTEFMPNQPVITEDRLYSAQLENDQPVIRAFGRDKKLTWQVAGDGRGDLILAGSRLYAAGTKDISVLSLPDGDDKLPKVDKLVSLDVQVERLLAGDGKLFAVTLDGRIMAFGKAQNKPPKVWQANVKEIDTSEADRVAAHSLMPEYGGNGFGIWFGNTQHGLARAIAAKSAFVQLALVDSNRQRVDATRAELDAAGLYGRVTAHHSSTGDFNAPPYVAQMIFVSPEWSQPFTDDATLVAEVYESLRPYGGTMHLLCDAPDKSPVIHEMVKKIESLRMEQATVEAGPYGAVVRRVGPLPKSGDWTHQYGDVANTLKSNDARVKLPLGVLWFGGNSNVDILPRHGHGPPEQIIGGRLFIEGMSSLSARDVYTGRVLWKREFNNLGTHDIYFDDTYKDTPLDPAYNQIHIPGANGRGTNFVATEDRVYILEGAVCHVLDPATGHTLTEIAIPQSDPANPVQWAYIGVYRDVLLGGLGFANYRDRHAFTKDAIPTNSTEAKKAAFGLKSLDRSASAGLIAFDRKTGKQLWRADAVHSFWHNGIVAGNGKVFCLDKNPTPVEDLLRRRGKSLPSTYRIVALDHLTGQTIWEKHDGVFGTWLGFSEKYDLLLQAGASASDRLAAETGQGMAVLRGQDGAVQWYQESLKYSGPCVLHNDTVITNANSYAESAGAFSLINGSPRLIPNPITGQLQPWKLTRSYGCNSIIASENLLTFRSGAAGFYDLATHAGTGNLGGFRSGCTANLIVANGVLNAPDYTRTCSCGYQNQTSLALVHMPELDLWSANHSAKARSAHEQIGHIGINFGAPGDRKDSGGVLWVEYPETTQDDSPVPIMIDGDVRYFRDQVNIGDDSQLPWVTASGIEGVQSMRISMLPPVKTSKLVDGRLVEIAQDDAEEDELGDVDLSSSDLELVSDVSRQTIGLRFNNITIPRGGKVRSAAMQFTCDEVSTEPTQLTIFAEAAGNSAKLDKKRHDISARSRTSNSIAWTVLAWEKEGAASSAQRSPDLAAIIQEVVNRADWKPGNSLTLLLTGTGKRVAAAATGKGATAPRLIIDADEIEAVSTITVAEHPYRVRILCGAPQHVVATAAKLEARVFDLWAQGKKVLEDVTVSTSSAPAIHTLDHVMIGRELELRFEAEKGQSVISGIELERL